MQTSAMMYSFTQAVSGGQMTIYNVVEFVRSLGVTGLELAGDMVAAEDPTAFGRYLQGLGMSPVAYGRVVDLAQPTASARRAAVAEAKAEIERAAALSAPVMLIVPGSFKESMDRGAAKEAVYAGLALACEHARACGVTLTIEDHSLGQVTGASSESLLEACTAAGPDLKITFDTGNFLFAGEDPLLAWQRLAPRVAHVHVKDWELVPPGTGPGPRQRRAADGATYGGTVLNHGIIPNPALIAAMKRSGYPGYLSVEYEGAGDPRPAMREGVEYMRSLLASA
ncbi:MAG: sugar phosphate isomerase/epimerase family protein [Anaerolineae bacterium]